MNGLYYLSDQSQYFRVTLNSLKSDIDTEIMIYFLNHKKKKKNSTKISPGHFWEVQVRKHYRE